MNSELRLPYVLGSTTCSYSFRFSVHLSRCLPFLESFALFFWARLDLSRLTSAANPMRFLLYFCPVQFLCAFPCSMFQFAKLELVCLYVVPWFWALPFWLAWASNHTSSPQTSNKTINNSLNISFFSLKNHVRSMDIVDLQKQKKCKSERLHVIARL